MLSTFETIQMNRVVVPVVPVVTKFDLVVPISWVSGADPDCAFVRTTITRIYRVRNVSVRVPSVFGLPFL